MSLSDRLNLIANSGSAASLRNQLAEFWPALNNSALKQLAIVGAAGEGVRLASLCHQLGIRVLAIADDDLAKQGIKVEANIVVSIEKLSALDRSIPIVVASHRALLPVRQIRQMGFHTVCPFMALQLMDPVTFPPHMFHEGILEDLFANVEHYRDLGAMLADNRSREVLSAVIAYRLCCDPEVLDSVVEWDLYGPSNLLEYGKNEVYVDAGAFDGDSIRLFIDRVSGDFSRVIGFEPDPVTFKKLEHNFSSEPRVTPINAGLFSKKGELRFDDAGTRGSILVSSGGIVVPVVSLDDVLSGERVSYIKMNIEGAEIDALQGASQSIKKWGPKLAISAYHHPDHLWKISRAITGISPDYQLYLRQHDGGIIETVMFAVLKQPQIA
jgi:FkbM family methyltransferase